MCSTPLLPFTFLLNVIATTVHYTVHIAFNFQVPDFVLEANVPVLSMGTHGYKVSLVDNPGSGEVNEMITQVAEFSAKSSSVYVYVTTPGSVGGTIDATFFENLAKECPGML